MESLTISKFLYLLKCKKDSTNVFPLVTEYMSKSRMWLTSLSLPTPDLLHNHDLNCQSEYLVSEMFLIQECLVKVLWMNVFFNKTAIFIICSFDAIP